MRKTFHIILAFVFVAIAVSCTEKVIDDVVPIIGNETSADEIVNFIFNVAPDADTKTSIEATGATPKVSWVAGDKIYVLPEVSVTGTGSTVPLEASNIDSNDPSSANFNVKTNNRSSYYDALYPSSSLYTIITNSPKQIVAKIPREQTGSFGQGHLAISRSTTSDGKSFSFHFSNVTNFIQFTLANTEYQTVILTGNNGEVLSGTIALDTSTSPFTATPYSEGSGASYTDVRLDINGKPGTYYIGFLPTDFQKGFTLRFLKEGEASSKKVVYVSKRADFSGKNKIIDLGSIDEKIITELPEGAINGRFTVNAEGKQVCFAKGNLTYDVKNKKWAFFEHQNDHATKYDANLISLFTWGYGDWSTVPDTQDNSAGSGFTDWGTVFDDQGTWRTLSQSEWEYLIEHHEYKAGSVNLKPCIFLIPDGHTKEGIYIFYTQESLAEAENEIGLVCLPYTDLRKGNDVRYKEQTEVSFETGYWTSTAFGNSGAHTMRILWTPDGLSCTLSVWEKAGEIGYPVRLVTDVIK